MARSQNGYIAPPPGGAYTWLVPTKPHAVPLPLRNGAAGFVLVWLALAFSQTVERIAGFRDDWGYAYRPIRGYSSTLSNHASGTAIDLNATRHGLGVRGTFAHVWQVTKILWLVHVRLRHVVRWGGEYEGRPDEMHFELNAPQDRVIKVARRLARTKRGRAILAANRTATVAHFTR